MEIVADRLYGTCHSTTKHVVFHVDVEQSNRTIRLRVIREACLVGILVDVLADRRFFRYSFHRHGSFGVCVKSTLWYRTCQAEKLRESLSKTSAGIILVVYDSVTIDSDCLALHTVKIAKVSIAARLAEQLAHQPATDQRKSLDSIAGGKIDMGGEFSVSRKSGHFQVSLGLCLDSILWYRLCQPEKLSPSRKKFFGAFGTGIARRIEGVFLFFL